MNRTLWLTLISLLAGFADKPQPVEATPPLTVFHVIPFTMGESHVPIVTAVINVNPDHPEVHPPTKRIGIDTGAARTAFDAPPDMIGSLQQVLPSATLEDRETADGTVISVCHIPRAQVILGDVTMNMPVDAAPHKSVRGEEMDGVIGCDFLSRFDVRFDFQAHLMTLTER